MSYASDMGHDDGGSWDLDDDPDFPQVDMGDDRSVHVGRRQARAPHPGAKPMNDDQTQALELHEDIIASIVIDGDLSGLNQGQLIAYYYHRCGLLGLDPGEKPFDLLRLNGKLMLYCTKAGSAALCRKNHISVTITGRDMLDGLCIHTASASAPSGRVNDDVGVVDIDKLRGEKLANAIMKSATKAKRRAVLGLCGTGLLDESELEGVQGAVEHVSIGAIIEAEQRALPPAKDSATVVSILQRRVALSALVDKPTDDIWREVCRRLQADDCDGQPVEPEHLTREQAVAADAMLAKWIEAKKPKPPAEDPTAEDAP